MHPLRVSLNFKWPKLNLGGVDLVLLLFVGGFPILGTHNSGAADGMDYAGRGWINSYKKLRYVTFVKREAEL